MMDGLSAGWQRERAETQMTLGALIERLEALPQDLLVEGICDPHSYRGYYQDLAFETSASKIPVSQALQVCRDCMGEVFQGYKGGDYQMGRQTPVWLASEGCCGQKVVALTDEGAFETKEDTY